MPSFSRRRRRPVRRSMAAGDGRLRDVRRRSWWQARARSRSSTPPAAAPSRPVASTPTTPRPWSCRPGLAAGDLRGPLGRGDRGRSPRARSLRVHRRRGGQPRAHCRPPAPTQASASPRRPRAPRRAPQPPRPSPRPMLPPEARESIGQIAAHRRRRHRHRPRHRVVAEPPRGMSPGAVVSRHLRDDRTSPGCADGSSWSAAMLVARLVAAACDDGAAVTTGIVIDVRQTGPATVTGFTLRADDGRLLDFEVGETSAGRRQLPERPPARPPGQRPAGRRALRDDRRRPDRHPPGGRSVTRTRSRAAALARSRRTRLVRVARALRSVWSWPRSVALPVPSWPIRSATPSARRCRSASTSSGRPSRSASRSRSPSGPTRSRSGRPRRASGRFPRWARAALRTLGVVAWLWIIVQVLVVGGSSDADVSSLFLWVYGWVGLALVSAFVGPGLVVARPVPVGLRPDGGRRPPTRRHSRAGPHLARAASATGRRSPASPSSSGSSWS